MSKIIKGNYVEVLDTSNSIRVGKIGLVKKVWIQHTLGGTNRYAMVEFKADSEHGTCTGGFNVSNLRKVNKEHIKSKDKHYAVFYLHPDDGLCILYRNVLMDKNEASSYAKECQLKDPRGQYVILKIVGKTTKPKTIVNIEDV